MPLLASIVPLLVLARRRMSGGRPRASHAPSAMHGPEAATRCATVRRTDRAWNPALRAGRLAVPSKQGEAGAASPMSRGCRFGKEPAAPALLTSAATHGLGTGPASDAPRVGGRWQGCAAHDPSDDQTSAAMPEPVPADPARRPTRCQPVAPSPRRTRPRSLRSTRAPRTGEKSRGPAPGGQYHSDHTKCNRSHRRGLAPTPGPNSVEQRRTPSYIPHPPEALETSLLGQLPGARVDPPRVSRTAG